MNLQQRWLARFLLAALCTGVGIPGAQAAKISDLRGGVNARRARLVLSLDESIRYSSKVVGRQLVVTLKGSTDRTREVHLRDPRVRKAYIEPKGSGSQLVIVFRGDVPEYKVFRLKKPDRLVVDFPKKATESSKGAKDNRQWLGKGLTYSRATVNLGGGKVSIEPALAYEGTLTRPDGKTYPIGGINRMRLGGEIIQYNDGYDDSTGTNRYGTEVRVVKGKVTEVRNGGNMPLYSGSTVFSGNGAGAMFLRKLKKGDSLKVSQTLGNAAADGAPTVGTAGPQLVYNGRVAVTSGEEDIAWGRAPRTAVGVKKDGTVLIVVADGRSDYSAGMSLEELARFFLRLGADRAMNFDGGGSSEMVVNGRIMNDPSDGDERPVRVALGVVRK